VAGAVSVAGNLGDAGAAGAAAEPACMQTYPTVVDGLTSRYKQGTIRQSWVDAERDCETDGGHLIVIDDEAENNWMAQIAALSLTNQGSSHQLAWLGLGDHAKEGEFRWVTGAPLTLTFWFSNEPNSLNKAEDCGEMRASGLWNDDRCNAELAYVCECDGLPSAGEWCDTDDNATCGDCSTACASDQACTSQLCK
jgi:Lectin C-type domain